MTFAANFSLGGYLPESVAVPIDPKQQAIYLKNRLEEILRALNRKDIASYEMVELMNGQQFFGATPQEKRFTFRKLINTGALPNAVLKPVLHNLNDGNPVPNTWVFTRIYGFALNPATPRWIPMPNAGPGYQVQLDVTALNVNITTAANLTAFTESYIVIEYWKA